MMSYCRWSSDDFRCDVYAYESDAGFIVHVARSRYVGDIPRVPFILDTPNDEWMKAYNAQHKFLETAKQKNIGKEYDGETFQYDTLAELYRGLRNIKAKGYRIPEWVFIAVIEEIDEAAKEKDEQ
jgi:hypothetical protein